jgi:Holliday junction resolvase RusA-like endonuclease|uniref:Endodeoxyribonuclease RusA n=1 Tax=Siphoviridae sp. cthh925 TaxID=2826425 RepID=A0A8S5NN29_9CAUD|nr:MAG TPA: Endodeoxyribonuclease RusA [Siphoviridae sp. cthh925]DAM81856.1 MAG TPA: Endodeoxyribonuclease RusA [Caudoviricetes sp.]
MKRNFNIPGKVQAKQRPRFNGKFAYTPKETIAYENWVRTCYLEKYRGQPILENPLKVKIIAYYEIPKSTSKKRRLEMKDDKVFPTVKPDTDNIAKSILDSLNNIAYLDDKQVVKLEVEKYYSDVASVVVMIDEVENERE